MLVAAAAAKWNAPASEIRVSKGVVSWRDRRATFGQLAADAAKQPVPQDVALKDPKDFKLLGQSIPRLDIPEKVNGSAEFGLDVKRPGMLVARIVRCPMFGGKADSFNADRTKAVPGVRHVDVELVWEPQWGMDMMSDEARLELGFM